MKRKTIGSASTLEDLILLFNEKCYSNNWIAKKDEDGKLRFYNKVLNRFKSDLEIIKRGDRFAAVMG